jgi:hypothetical protein
MADDFQLFTSLRYDPILVDLPGTGFRQASWNYTNPSALYMLNLHRDRMLRAATHWNWTAAIQAIAGDSGLQTLTQLYLASVTADITNPIKVKITLNRDGQISVQTWPVPATPLENLFPARLPPPGSSPESGGPSREPEYEVLVDSVRTSKSEFTHFKTTQRVMYDQARSRAALGLADMKEILLVNAADGSVMEGSARTPYFWRNGRWITPPVSAAFGADGGSGGQDGTSRRWALERSVFAPRRKPWDNAANE